jgi:hypothetical protein
LQLIIRHFRRDAANSQNQGEDPRIQGMETTTMARAGWKEIVLLLVCVSIPCIFSCVSRAVAGGQILMVDFGALYYGARCAVQHTDPYDSATVLRAFQKDGNLFAPTASDQGMDQIVVTRIDNLPTAMSLTVPFTLLPWSIAQNVWMILMAILLVVAAFLTWNLGAGAAPLLWAALAGFMLAESDLLFKGGNVAGIVVSLCVIAVWCFLNERCAWAGVLMLAVSLVLKPHDCGFIWLYFLMAGGTLRKRALQTLAVTGVLAACAAIWISTVSPHWFSELHRNLDFLLAHGGASDPGPAGMSSYAAGMVIDLQSLFSFVKDNPHFYNPLAWLIGGLPILTVAVTAWRKPATPQGSRLALAALSALMLLPVYHRINDAGILLLALPACAILWKDHTPERWLALGLTSAGILCTASTPLAFMIVNFRTIAAFASRLPGRLPAAMILRPTPVVLLVMGYFYLWMYLRHVYATAEKPAAATPVVSAAG